MVRRPDLGGTGATAATCGNGMVDSGETCDPPGTCPASCDGGNACTTNQMSANTATCNVACAFNAIVISAPAMSCNFAGCTGYFPPNPLL